MINLAAAPMPVPSKMMGVRIASKDLRDHVGDGLGRGHRWTRVPAPGTSLAVRVRVVRVRVSPLPDRPPQQEPLSYHGWSRIAGNLPAVLS
jgi:hypothetical protein